MNRDDPPLQINLTPEQYKKAAAVGRLMLGEFDAWSDFRFAAAASTGPRRLRRAQVVLDRKGLAPEVQRFCRMNFEGMTVSRLAQLYGLIEDDVGLRLPRQEFESRFAIIKAEVALGVLAHATVSLTLWGLQFEYPESHFARDIGTALLLLQNAESQLQLYRDIDQATARRKQEEIALIQGRHRLAVRMLVIQSFSLLECYLNGIAWDFLLHLHCEDAITEKDRKLLEDRNGKFRDKLIRYQHIIFNQPILEETSDEIRFVLQVMKPFRDSLMHPSPFSRPDQFGGLDKLQRIYQLTDKDARQAVATVAAIISRIEEHRTGRQPSWLVCLGSQ